MKAKRIKKLKKMYSVGGDMGTQGVFNDAANRNHIYLSSGERTLAGIAQGLADTIGLGSLVQASNDAMGVSDQLNKSKEYKTASGITGGIAGLGMNAVSMIGKGMGNTPKIDSPNINVSDMGYVTPELTPDNSSTEITGLQNNGYDIWNFQAKGGFMYPNGGTLPTPQEIDDWNNYLKYYNQQVTSGKITDESLDKGPNTFDINTWNSYKQSNPNFSYDHDPFVSKMQQYYNDLYNDPRMKTANKMWYDAYTKPGLSNVDSRIGSYTRNYYIPKRDINNTNTGTTEYMMYNPYDPNSLDYKYTPNISSMTQPAIHANGGQMLTEFNAGGTHEENPLGGIPVGQNSLVEEDETKFTPLDNAQPEFVFSEREKDKKTGRSFSSLSKSIKNKYKLRPHDSMAKESMDKELKTLADNQEAQKQEKAMKLMNKAMELSPEMFQAQGMDQMQMMGKGGKLGKLKRKLAWGGTEPPTVNDLFVGPQLQNQQRPPYSLFVDNATNVDPNNQPTFAIDPDTNPTGNGDATGYAERMLFESPAPKDLTGVKAGMFGLQALGESLRLGMTPNSKLTGNISLDRVNPNIQKLIVEEQANQQRANYMSAVKEAGLSPSQYLAAVTTGLGDMSIGNAIAGVDAQGQLTNAGIQHQEAQINKNLERERNDIQAQDIANRSNQLGAVGAGLVQNMSGVLTDKQKKEMDMFSLPFVATKENYDLRYNPETGTYQYYYVPPMKEGKKSNAYGGRLKKLKKYGGKMKNC